LGRWVLGGVVERTVRFSSCPVAIIPGDYDLAPWGSGGGRPRPPRIVVGLDDAGGSHNLYDFVVDLRRRKGCDVDFLHFYWPLEEYARLGLRGPRDLFSPDPEVIANLEPKLRAKIAEEVEGRSGQGAIAVDIRPAWGEPAANLLLAMSDLKADLLVVGLEPRRGLGRFFGGSVAERLAHHASRLAIVAVPERPAPAATHPAIPRLGTVLAATDFSTASKAAIPQVYALLRASGGIVELCHVYEHGLPSPPYAYDRPEDHLSLEKRAALEDELRSLIPEEAPGLGITTHVTVIDGGRAADAIVQAAERLNADVIALASEGRTGIARAVLGSVAQEVLHRARRPVFVIRGR
jgi:nucleotide-binding universal stress UspA family protein